MSASVADTRVDLVSSATFDVSLVILADSDVLDRSIFSVAPPTVTSGNRNRQPKPVKLKGWYGDFPTITTLSGAYTRRRPARSRDGRHRECGATPESKAQRR